VVVKLSPAVLSVLVGSDQIHYEAVTDACSKFGQLIELTYDKVDSFKSIPESTRQLSWPADCPTLESDINDTLPYMDMLQKGTYAMKDL